MLLWAGLACGYRLSDPKQVFGPDVQRIRIELLENKSAEPGFERLLGDALVEEFTRRGLDYFITDDPVRLRDLLTQLAE